MGPVSPHTGMSSASRCRRYLQPTHKKPWCELPSNGEKINSNVALAYSAGVALQELDLLVQLDVVRPQAVQLILQGLHGLLHRAILLQVETEETSSRGFRSPHRGGRGPEDRGDTHHFQLLVARAESLPLAGDD